jgi:hypothetical protein
VDWAMLDHYVASGEFPAYTQPDSGSSPLRQG